MQHLLSDTHAQSHKHRKTVYIKRKNFTYVYFPPQDM